MRSLSRNAVLALIGVTLVLHSAEEYWTFPQFLSSASQLPRWLPPPRLFQHSGDIQVALVIVTVIALSVISWAILSPRKVALILALLIESILLVNTGWHILASFDRGGYAPGVITAVLINLPFGVYVLRRAVKEKWIRAQAAWRLLAIAVAFHFILLGSLLAG